MKSRFSLMLMQMESSAGKQHIAAVEAYTRQCMKSRAGAGSDDDVGTPGRMSGTGRGATRACRSDEHFTSLELINSRESRPNNLVCSTGDVLRMLLSNFFVNR